VWQNALKIRSAADNFDKMRDFAARAQHATTNSERSSSRTGFSESLRRNTAMSGRKAMTPQTWPTRCSHRRIPDTRPSLACNRIVTTSDGVSLSVRDWGSHAAGHTVVLLHGFCLNKESWNIQMAQLIHLWGNNIRIISYDHRGHGDSGSASMHTYRIDGLADDLAGLVVALGVTGPLTLVGHSMGGMTVLAYLRRCLCRVEPSIAPIEADRRRLYDSSRAGAVVTASQPAEYHARNQLNDPAAAS
jgi:hypothetical protein